jgi:hypothetical protein
MTPLLLPRGQKRFMFFCSSSCPDVHRFFLALFLLPVLPHFLRLSSSNFVYLSFSTPSFSLAPFLLSVLLLPPSFTLNYFFFSLSLALYLQSVLLHLFCLSCFLFICLTQPVDPSQFLILASFVQICFYIFSKFLSVSFTFNLSQSLPSVCLTRFLSISHTLTPSFSRSVYLFVFFVTCLSVYLPVSSNFMSIKPQISYSLRLQNYFLSLALGCELIASFTIVSESSQMNCLVLHVE